MRKLLIPFLIVMTNLLFAQERVFKHNFNDNNIIIFHTTIKNNSGQLIDVKLNCLMNRMEEIYFCTIDMNSSKCKFVAAKDLDLNIIKKLFNNSSYTVEFDIRQPFTKENFLRIYTT
ncbi:MAG: hypothetical protein HY738_03205 [Bacteroidia bacterium]|nr:hypothetical protein [Bacteroidia bacterium]